MQISRFGNLTQSRAGLLRSLEARASRLTVLAELALRALKFRLSALHFTESPLFGACHRKKTKTRCSGATLATETFGSALGSGRASSGVVAMRGIEAGGFSAIAFYVR